MCCQCIDRRPRRCDCRCFEKKLARRRRQETSGGGCERCFHPLSCLLSFSMLGVLSGACCVCLLCIPRPSRLSFSHPSFSLSSTPQPRRSRSLAAPADRGCHGGRRQCGLHSARMSRRKVPVRGRSGMFRPGYYSLQLCKIIAFSLVIRMHWFYTGCFLGKCAILMPS